MNIKGINLSSDIRKLLISKGIDFIDFLEWYQGNKEKINKVRFITISESNFKRYFNNPDENISILIYFFNKRNQEKII